LFLVLAIITGLNCCNFFDLIIIYLLAFAALLTQPIAGLPALFLALILSVYHSDYKKFKKYFYALIYFLTAISLPLAFYIVEKNNLVSDTAANSQTYTGTTPVATTGGYFSAFFSWFKITNLQQENIILNFIYFYGFNLSLAFLIVIILGAAVAWRYREQCRITAFYLGISLSLLTAYLLTKLLPFKFLISYERDNFSERIILCAAFFLLPFLIIAFFRIISPLLQHNNFIKISFFTFAAVLITTSFYLSYPRFDKYFNSHGYSIGKNDIKAVRWISDNAGKDYIVLANQQVSVAALREYGFLKYYKIAAAAQPSASPGEVFYYPIPTGGPLYQFYLDMVYKKPSRETMEKAMDFAGVDEGYFVLNKYWWAFPKILDEAKLVADSWEEIGNGEVYIFKYNIKKQITESR
jgi:archaellin